MLGRRRKSSTKCCRPSGPTDKSR